MPEAKGENIPCFFFQWLGSQNCEDSITHIGIGFLIGILNASLQQM